MSDQNHRNHGSLVPAGRRDLTPVAAANPLVSRGLAGLSMFSRKDEARQCFNRGISWLDKREYEKAIIEFDEAIRLDPNYPLAFFKRGFAWTYRIVDAIFKKKDYDKAIADYNEATRLDPKCVPAYYNRGWVWSAMKRYDEAIKDFDESIRLDSSDPIAYHNRGMAWFEKGNHDKAIQDFNKAVRLLPNSALFYYYHGYASCDEAIRFSIWGDGAFAIYNYAWLLADLPREKLRAIEAAMKACNRRDWKSALDLDALAASFAEAGRFEEAERYQAMALDLPPEVSERRGRFRFVGKTMVVDSPPAVFHMSTKDDRRARLELSKKRVSNKSTPLHELLRDKIDQVLNTLTESERELIGFRYGGEWIPNGMVDAPTLANLDEACRKFKVTPERIKEIEANTVRMLQQEGFGDQEHIILGKPVAELNLPSFARRCLEQLGVSVLGELVLHSAEELLETKDFAVLWLGLIRERLCQFGLRLRGD